MCGINGIFAYHSAVPGVDRDELIRTRDWMWRRGPDGSGAWFSDDGRVGLGHRRLAIIDLSANGAQPMATADRRFQIVFNGEIYNYRELRGQLVDKGVRFESQSDTEVLLHLYRAEGAAMVHRLRGMFAFAIWDEERKELFFARDPYGIKPLYYCDDGRVFRFASQVKALQASLAISKELDPAGATGFLLWGSVPEPSTLYKDIRLLPAGSTMHVTAAGCGAVRNYWSLRDVIASAEALSRTVSPGDEDEIVRNALTDSVRAHMVADVPVGAFLSAGLDSSTVVGLARELSSNAIKTVTLAFDEFKDSELDEAPIASLIAQHLNVENHARRITLEEVEADLPKFLDAMDQPTIDGLNTWLVSKATAEAGLKVALSGVGGDELLGGYASFQRIPEIVESQRNGKSNPLFKSPFRFAYSSWTHRLPGFACARLLKRNGGYLGAYHVERGVFMPWEIGQVLRRDFAIEGLAALCAREEQLLAATGSPGNAFAQVVELESTRYMRNQLLRDTDWAGMAHSLEIRVPLVDRVLTEAIVGMSVAGRLGKGKSILPRSLARGLPGAAINRPKTGFTLPIWRWLNKSRELDAWKSVRLLKKAHTHDYKRWAYSLFVRMLDTQGVLAHRSA